MAVDNSTAASIVGDSVVRATLQVSRNVLNDILDQILQPNTVAVRFDPQGMFMQHYLEYFDPETIPDNKMGKMDHSHLRSLEDLVKRYSGGRYNMDWVSKVGSVRLRAVEHVAMLLAIVDLNLLIKSIMGSGWAESEDRREMLEAGPIGRETTTPFQVYLFVIAGKIAAVTDTLKVGLRK